MLKELVVISGKGGTGKTSIVAALASLLPDKVLGDCDVDAADLHLVVQPHNLEKKEFWSGKTAFIEPTKCSQCGKCLEVCRYSAISPDFVVDKVSCEGCGVCAHFCPTGALELKDNLCGHIFVSETPYGYMVHAKLGIAEENSGKLVSIVKSRAKTIAQAKNLQTVLIDGPPGIGCPVIASLAGSNLVLAVTEPTLSGLHDLERVLALTKHFRIPAAVCINKSDLNPRLAELILQQCKELGIKVLTSVPYDESITKAQARGVSVIEFSADCPAALALKELAVEVSALLQAE